MWLVMLNIEDGQPVAILGARTATTTSVVVLENHQQGVLKDNNDDDNNNDSWEMAVTAAANDLDVSMTPILDKNFLPRRIPNGVYVLLFMECEWELVKLYNCNPHDIWRYCIVATNEYGATKLDREFYGRDHKIWVLLKAK